MTESDQARGTLPGAGSAAQAAPAQATHAQQAHPHNIASDIKLRLINFPISFFAMILGLAGFTIAVQRAEMILKLHEVLHLPFKPSLYMLGFTVTLFFIILAIYATKAAFFWGEVKKEIAHPIRLNFFPTISISLLLFSISTLGLQKNVSFYLWVGGTILHALFTLYIMSIWIQHPKFEIKHFNASWFIPVVGNIIIPVAGAEHGFFEISWFFFSIGFVFWVVLLAILFNRLIFHNPLPQKLIPTLFIMIAPPAVGFISYVKVNHEHLDNFAHVLYYFALFSLALLVFQFRLFSRLQFFLSWWAYSFPLAAMTIASLFRLKLLREEHHALTEAAAAGGGEAVAIPHVAPIHLTTYTVLSYTLLTVVTVVILMLLVRTVLAVGARQICVEED
jgi:tellurite resistance protein